MTSIWNKLAVVTALWALVSTAAAQQVYLHLENDILAGSDGHYTGGIELGWHAGRVSVLDRRPDLVWQLKLLVFTPKDITLDPPDPNDLPYAGVALLQGNLFFRQMHQRYDQFGVQLGWMGPGTRLGELQQQFHRTIGNRVPRGWDTQLPDQPLAGVVYTHARRLWCASDERRSLQAHISGQLGNFARYVNGALLWRWGVDAGRVRAFDQILGTSASEALWVGRQGWQLDVGVQWNRFFHLMLLDDRDLPLRSEVVKWMMQLQYSWRHWQLALLLHQSRSILRTRRDEDRWAGLKLAYAFE